LALWLSTDDKAKKDNADHGDHGTLTAHRLPEAPKAEEHGTMLPIAQHNCSAMAFETSSQTPTRGGTTVLQWMRVRHDDMQWVVRKSLDL
jgi:hypothetical protein